MATQTVEQFLFEQLEKVAPGKYTVAGVLQQFKSKLRFPCTHLKGGRNPRLQSIGKDYNLSIFTFIDGVIEIKCLYNCGLKIRSDEKDLVSAFNELYDFPTTNTKAKSESFGNLNPGPAPVYSDAYRQRLRDSAEMFWDSIAQGLTNGRIKPDDKVLGGVFQHPDPVEAPDSIIERGLTQAHRKTKSKPFLKMPLVVVQDSVPALEPVKTFTKIRKARKTQSRQRKRSGK